MSKPDISKLKDADARRAITEDVKNNYFVEAGAGTGKTYSLVGRMLSLIADGQCRIETLAAVTFTRKAAAELRERFQVALEKKQHEVEGERRTNLRRALRHIERAFIGTIHSFCGRLLRERPIEAGLDPGFEEVDEIAHDAILLEAWREYVDCAAHGEQLKQLYELGIEAGEVEGAFLKLALYPDVEIAHEPVDVPDFRSTVKEVRTFLDGAKQNLPDVEPPRGWDWMQQRVRTALRMFHYFDMAEPMDVVRLLKVFSRANAPVTLSRWTDSAIAKTLKNTGYPAFKLATIDPALTRWREFVHHALIEFLSPALESARKYRLRQGKLTYQDLLMEAARLLRERPEVRGYFQRKFTHLLVDEFQDTDPVQAELMFLLCCKPDEMDVRDWRRVSVSPGRLFVVGDPKQSIYRFRRADIRTYAEVYRRLHLTAGRAATLSSNFRSIKAMCEWVNFVFKDVFPAESTAEQAAYVPQYAVRPESPPEAVSGVFRLAVPPPAKGRDGQPGSNARTAPLVASLIAGAMSGGWKLADKSSPGKVRPARPEDFLVLTSRKKPLSLYAEALEEFGVPCEVTGAALAGADGPVGQLLLLAEALGDTADQVKLAGVLRGPFFGVSDDSLYRFKQCGGTFNLLADVPDTSPPELTSAIKKLRGYRRLTTELAPTAAFERIVGDLGIVPLESSMPLGTGRAGYLMQFIELARNTSPEDAPSFHALAGHLSELVENGALGDANLFPGVSQAVRVMNLHKAKGLEARVVILADAFDGGDPPPEGHVDRTVHPAKGHFVITRKRKNRRAELIAQPPGWEAIALKEQRFLDAEKERLLYVAATRAADVLVVCGRADKPEYNRWKVLFDAIPPERVITIPEVEPPLLEEVSVSAKLLKSAASARDKAIAKLGAESWSTSTVTAVAKRDAGELPQSSGGLGAGWGSVVHGALEALGRGIEGAELERFVLNALAVEEVPNVLLPDVLDQLGRIRRSDIWSRMQKSFTRLFEVPFAVLTTAGKLGIRDRPQKHPVLLRGQVDLVFKEDAGWVIVDFKTDSPADGLEGHVEYYSPQLKLYAEYWKEVTGEGVSEILLYFVTAGEVVNVI